MWTVGFDEEYDEPNILLAFVNSPERTRRPISFKEDYNNGTCYLQIRHATSHGQWFNDMGIQTMGAYVYAENEP